VESLKRKAEGYAARTVAMAQAEADKRVFLAEGYRARKVASAQGQAGRFANQLAAYNASPSVFTNRSFLQAWARGATNSRKYVIMATNTTDTIQFNLEDRVRTDLSEIPVPKPK
jgi:modulator of FtsH protease HflK